jgi:pimeloyl-ACP methyl ester carboxylesterase
MLFRIRLAAATGIGQTGRMSAPSTPGPRVLILHGIWNARSWVAPLAWRLRAEGFDAEVFGYDSVFGGPEAAIPRLIDHLQASDGPIGLVGHSLGGVIALETLRRQPDLPVSRVVCLGSPLRGSLTARNLARHPWSAHALGRSGPLLLSGCAEWRGTAQVGMVAGNVARGFGRLLARFEGDSDGTVSVEETRLPGLSDHCIVAASHTGLVFSAEAAHQAANFLRHGRFTHPQARETGAATGAGTNRGTPASNGRTGAME